MGVTALIMEEARVCLECGNTVRGRRDKKFCSDMCRNTYNNQLLSFSNNIIRNINNSLKKNRRLLDELCPEDKSKVLKKTLVTKGFNFNHFTHQRRTQKGTVYYFVYDLGYLELESDFILIVRDQR